MPKLLSEQGNAVYAALLAESGMTSRIRSLASDIREACESGSALDWSEDLAALSIVFPEDESKREAFAGKLRSAFGTVASEATDSKRAASVRYIADTGEVAITFRTVKPRDAK